MLKIKDYTKEIRNKKEEGCRNPDESEEKNDKYRCCALCISTNERCKRKIKEGDTYCNIHYTHCGKNFGSLKGGSFWESLKHQTSNELRIGNLWNIYPLSLIDSLNKYSSNVKKLPIQEQQKIVKDFISKSNSCTIDYMISKIINYYNSDQYKTDFIAVVSKQKDLYFPFEKVSDYILLAYLFIYLSFNLNLRIKQNYYCYKGCSDNNHDTTLIVYLIISEVLQFLYPENILKIDFKDIDSIKNLLNEFDKLIFTKNKIINNSYNIYDVIENKLKLKNKYEYHLVNIYSNSLFITFIL